MNVYEEAHNLARAIRECNEFKDFDAKKKILEQDPDGERMMQEFQTLQLQIQTAQMTGQEPDQSAVQRLSNLYAVIMSKPAATEYLQAQLRFSVMMKDVYEILADVMNMNIKL